MYQYNFQQMPFGHIFYPVLVVVVIISLVLKGYALWHAARGEQKYWFIALLIVNSVGILDVLFLVFFKKDALLSRIAPPPAEPPVTTSPETNSN